MTQKQFLQKLGLSQEEFSDFLFRYTEFQQSLSPPQLAVLRRSLPDMERAALSFGPKVTAEDLNILVQETGESEGGHIFARGCFVAKLSIRPVKVPNKGPKKDHGKG